MVKQRMDLFMRMHLMKQKMAFINERHMLVKNLNKKIRQLVIAVSLAILLGSCSSNQAPLPYNFQSWAMKFTAPSNYEVWFWSAYGENDKENWRHPVHAGSYPGWRMKLPNVQKWLEQPDYEGYGIPLAHRVINYRAEQVGLAHKSLPDRLYINWVSRYSNTEYETIFEVSEELKQKMKVPFYPSWYGGLPCHKQDFTLAFLPNGIMKVWISDCNRYTYVGEVAPFSEKQRKMPEPGSTDMRLFKAAHAKGPIPWDKVNKVWLGPDLTMDLLSGLENIGVE